MARNKTMTAAFQREQTQEPLTDIDLAQVAAVRDIDRDGDPDIALDDIGGLEAAISEDMNKPFVVRELEAKAAIFRERNKLYGDNYKRFGPIMTLMLAGQQVDTTDYRTMNRLGILTQIVAKMTRYGENFSRGGHDDSLDDIAVYVMMLKELDHS